mmetsp:Transcript_45742/g.126929  ORF Transcript_45742/g.126929 Transcript_45742/m.126929 type:complete len:257 (+) Transcript_45742:683-1453(+)
MRGGWVPILSDATTNFAGSNWHHRSTFTMPPWSSLPSGFTTVFPWSPARPSEGQRYTRPSAAPVASLGGACAETSTAQTAPSWPPYVRTTSSNLSLVDQHSTILSFEDVKMYLPSADTAMSVIGRSWRDWATTISFFLLSSASIRSLRCASCWRLLSASRNAELGTSAAMSGFFSTTSECSGNFATIAINSLMQSGSVWTFSNCLGSSFSPALTRSSSFHISRIFFACLRKDFSSSLNLEEGWKVDSARQDMAAAL